MSIVKLEIPLKDESLMSIPLVHDIREIGVEYKITLCLRISAQRSETSKICDSARKISVQICRQVFRSKET